MPDIFDEVASESSSGGDIFDELSTERQQRSAALAEERSKVSARKPAGVVRGFASNLGEVAGDVARGAAQMPVGLLRLAGQTADAVRRHVPTGPELGVGGDRSALTAAGDWIERQVNRLPGGNPEDLATQFNQGVGQIGSMLATGAASRLAGSSGAVAGAVASGMGFGAEFDDAFGRARSRGDSPDLAFAKSLGYASVASMIENWQGAGRILRKLMPDARRAVETLTAWGVSKELVGNFAAGYAEEGAQRLAQNLIIAPEEDPLTGVHEEGRVGALVQGLVGIPGAGVRPSARRPDGRTDVRPADQGGRTPGQPAVTAPAAPPESATIPAGTRFMTFRDEEGREIDVEVPPGADADRYREATFLHHPGAQLVGERVVGNAEAAAENVPAADVFDQIEATSPQPAAPSGRVASLADLGLPDPEAGLNQGMESRPPAELNPVEYFEHATQPGARVQNVIQLAEVAGLQWDVDARSKRDIYGNFTPVLNPSDESAPHPLDVTRVDRIRAAHQTQILLALRHGNPVNAAAVDRYAIPLPTGYVRRGDLYVLEPAGTPVPQTSPPPVVPPPPPVEEQDAIRRELEELQQDDGEPDTPPGQVESEAPAGKAGKVGEPTTGATPQERLKLVQDEISAIISSKTRKPEAKARLRELERQAAHILDVELGHADEREVAAPPPAPEPPKPDTFTPPDMEMSVRLRGRVLAAVDSYLYTDQSDDHLRPAILRAVQQEFGREVGERVSAGNITPAQSRYINAFSAEEFTDSVLSYIRRQGLLRERPSDKQPATAPEPQENPIGVTPEPKPVDQPAQPADSVVEATNERTTDSGGPGGPGGVPGPGGEPGRAVERPPAVDAGTPAGPVPGVAQGGEAGPVVRPEGSASPPAGGQAGGRGNGPRGRARGSARAGKSPGGGTGGRPAQPVERTGAEGDGGGGALGGGVASAKSEEAPPPPEAPREVRPEDRNHVLPADQDWIPKGDKTKARANIAAIKLLRQLEAEGRNPTPEEKAVLAQYTGWGGLKEVFDTGKAAYRDRPDYYKTQEQRREEANWEKSWGKLYDEVKELLTPDEWDAARASVLNAHYTSRTVIRAMWDAIRRLGFRGGRVLEPAAGVGHFLGLMPEDLRARAKWSAVELDNVSGRILAKLYPQADVQVTGFESARIPANSLDLVVSNVPFAKDGPLDNRYPRLSLHNYFFVRGLDLVKPGGLLVAITSDSTMDNAVSRKAREMMAERADLVGAIRLPNTAFKENAGTEVTTDILIFRKRDGTPFRGEEFLATQDVKGPKGEDLTYNEYYQRHPEMMLGRMSREGTMYGRGDQQALVPIPGADLSAQLAEAITRLPADVFGAQELPGEQSAVAAERVVGKVGALVLQGGKPVVVNHDGTTTAPAWTSNTKLVKQAKAYIELREATRALIDAQVNPDATDAQLAGLRAELNRLYDAYVGQYGPVGDRPSKYLDDDVDHPMVTAIEDETSSLQETEIKTGKRAGQKRLQKVKTWTKSKLFSERTIFPRVAPTSAETVEDGYQVSLNYRGRVDLGYIAELTGQPEEQVKSVLVGRGLAFENPATGQMEPRWQYLSGAVKTKLRQAESAAVDNPAYTPNVEALKAVQPAPIPIEKIAARLGANWIPPSAIKRFIREKLEIDANVEFVPQTGNWLVEPVDRYAADHTALNTTTYGVHGFTGLSLVTRALNHTTPVVTTTETRISETTGKPYEAEVKDPKATAEAVEKQDQLKRLFTDWLKVTPSVGVELERIYNEQFNGVVAPSFEGPTWERYPGAAADITLRPHQKRFVTRMLQHSTLGAHAVGTGKTYSMITAAMEMRRLGLARKPVIVVQNATLEQFARSFKRLYPTARVLAPGRSQRDAANRQRTMSRIATGDWDAVIVPQSFINLMRDNPQREADYVRAEMAELEAALIEARAKEGKKSPKVADLERAIERLAKRLKELLARKVDNVLTFEQLGVDALFVDEAHAYKKLQFTTAMDNIKGLDKGASQRGLSMLLKVRWVQERNQGRNVVFATGTPVSNTLAEAWTMMRYLRPDLLKEYQIERFDDFAGTFASTVTSMEMTAGGTWQPVTRFARFVNGPELISLWRQVADVITAEEVNLPGLPALDTGKTIAVVVPQSPELTHYVGVLRAELERFAKMKGKEKRDNSHIPLVVFGRARKASLDMRMIDPKLPDQPASKLNLVADNVARIYHDSTPVLGTQMCFADLFQDNTDNPQFNAYEELKRKLIERGIPESEIVIITDKVKDERREALFDSFNEGRIRVAIGSSERMGVGVNAQERMIALHHMDAPHRPMDIEQRNGRILRQGNRNPTVQIFSYGVENTLDAAMYQRLASKQRFINQIIRGDLQGRNFEDAANEITMSFEEQMAAFSGDPLTLERVTLDNQVRQLEALRDGHIEQVRRSREELEDLTQRRIPRLKLQLVEAKAAAQRFESAFAGGDFELEVGGRTHRGRKAVVAAIDADWGKWLDAMREGVNEAAKEIKGTFARTFNTKPTTLTLNGQKVVASGYVWATRGTDDVVKVDTPKVEWKFDGVGSEHSATTGQGFLQGVAAELENIGRHIPTQIEGDIARMQRNERELASFVQQPFEREAELQQAKRRLAEVDAKLAEAGKVQKADAAQEAKRLNPFDFPRQPKPLEAQRAMIYRLLGEMEQREQRAEEAPTTEEADRAKAIANPARVVTLTNRLREIEEEMIQRLDKLKMDLRGAVTAFGVLPATWNAAIDVVKVAIKAGVSLAEAVARGLAHISKHQPKRAWDRLSAQRALESVAAAAAAGTVSPEAETQLAMVEAAAQHTNQRTPTGPRPMPVQMRSRLRDALASQSNKVVYYGSADLLRSKQELDLTTSYQSAAVRRQSDELVAKLFNRAYDAQTGWKLPRWMGVGAWANRTREFKRRMLHLAARLNATGRNPDGSFRFDDFEARAGIMTARAFKKGGHNVGDVIVHQDPNTGLNEELVIGQFVTTPEGRQGFQLSRRLTAAVQGEIYRSVVDAYPDQVWLLDLFIDPALAGMRQRINGVEVPVFNRFASAAMMAANDPGFTPLTGYTPDVLVSRSLMGAIGGALSFRAGTRSPGRRYKFGTSRESGHVRDLLTGFNVRTLQMLQENARREWRQAILKAATPIPRGGVPEGWVKVQTGMDELWQAVRRLRRWTSPVDAATGDPLYPETEARMTDDGGPQYAAFFGEAAALRGRQLMLPRKLVDVLLKQHIAHVEHGALYRLGAWAIRNSTQLLLVHPYTYVGNVVTNAWFELEAGTKYALRGLASLNPEDLRAARGLFGGLVCNRFVGLRRALGLGGGGFLQAVNDVLPDQVFADSTSLSDVKVRWGTSMVDYLRSGEIGAAALVLVRYGQIDIRAKQRVAYAILKAKAVTDARRAGLRGRKLREAVQRYMSNPPTDARRVAVEAANFEILNYADSPGWLNRMVENDYARAIAPFPRFGYHYVAKQAKRLSALKLLLGKVPPAQRADALADLLTVGLFGLGGGGLLADAILKAFGGGDDEEARRRIGASTVWRTNPDGSVVQVPIDREFVLVNRINLSRVLSALGLGGDREEEFWLRVRQYPMVAVGGILALAFDDAQRFGPAAGVKTLASGVGDLASDFFAVGAAVKVPSKLLAEWQGMGKVQPVPSVADPYATHVPTSLYVTEQLLDTFVPGTRQADELVAMIDPVRRRRTASKTLGYQPGVIEGLRVGHWTGLIDRLAHGGTSPLPPAGAIDRRTGRVDPSVLSPLELYSRFAGVNLRRVNTEQYREALSE